MLYKPVVFAEIRLPKLKKKIQFVHVFGSAVGSALPYIIVKALIDCKAFFFSVLFQCICEIVFIAKFKFLTFDPLGGGKILTLPCLSTGTGQSWSIEKSC